MNTIGKILLAVIIVFVILFALSHFTNPNDNLKSIGYGYADTVVDGVEMNTINLFEDPYSSHRIVSCNLGMYEFVDILKDDGNYLLVKSKAGARGYCRREFIKDITWTVRNE